MVVYDDQETSVLQRKLLEHGNLVRYAEKLRLEFLKAPSSSSSPPLHSFPSSFSRKGKPTLKETYMKPKLNMSNPVKQMNIIRFEAKEQTKDRKD